ncbi:MAG: hypothetical protein EA361_01830 [Bacteroidetes bacterium]|nr:MAG: hypothetical protein EA361_01830 [Bacteroidota bacterium]
MLGFLSCSKDDDIPSHLKGIVQFKSYTTSQGLRPVIYSDGQLKFIVKMQLVGASSNVNVDIDFDILEGNTKIANGKVKVKNNTDGGLGMFWESDEHSHGIDAVALQGKTLTVYLDPANKYTGSDYADETYVNLYKKATITIP